MLVVVLLLLLVVLLARRAKGEEVRGDRKLGSQGDKYASMGIKRAMVVVILGGQEQACAMHMAGVTIQLQTTPWT